MLNVAKILELGFCMPISLGEKGFIFQLWLTQAIRHAETMFLFLWGTCTKYNVRALLPDVNIKIKLAKIVKKLHFF